MWVCRLPVHIGPLGSCEFAADFRKNGAICRVDVGIDPYGQIEKYGTDSPKSFLFRSCLLLDLSGASRQLPFEEEPWVQCRCLCFPRGFIKS